MKKNHVIAMLFIIFICLDCLVYKILDNNTMPIETSSTIITLDTVITQIVTPSPTSTPSPTPIPTVADSKEALTKMEEAKIKVEYYEDIYDLISDFNSLEEFEDYIEKNKDDALSEYAYYEDNYNALKEEERIKKENDKWAKKAKKYPTATKVWRYLTEDMGLSDVCAAGIMGNFMAECGGRTLKLNEKEIYYGYYGLAQWSKKYHPQVWGKDLDYQLAFLKKTLKQEFKNGTATYKQFINSKTPEEASIYFAKGYERCAKPYGRQKCARTAYKYFTS